VTVLALIVSAAIIGTGAAAPAAEPARMVIQLLDRLDLSSDQISSLRAVASRHRPAISSLVEREIETRAALREAIRRTPVDEAAIAKSSPTPARRFLSRRRRSSRTRSELSSRRSFQKCSHWW
jgi:Spy/CpxP family protein refolding chaperone